MLPHAMLHTRLESGLRVQGGKGEGSRYHVLTKSMLQQRIVRLGRMVASFACFNLGAKA